MSSKNMLLKIVGVIVGIVFVGYGLTERSAFSHIKSIGKPAVVEPIQSYTKRKSTYAAEFTFLTEKGQKITKKQSFPSELVADFEAQVPVKVLYNPANPSEFVFEKESASWLLIIGGIAFALVVILFA
jgi:hypothetical protein